MMAKKAKKEVKKSSGGDSKLFAFLAVLLSIIGFVIALVARRDDKYVIYYAKQSLVLFIACLIIGVIGWVPIIGWIMYPILVIIWVVLWIVAMIYSLSGNMKPVPIIGNFGDKINL
jgi:uncharacterized membrane protein